MPIDDAPLVLSPGHPLAAVYDGLNEKFHEGHEPTDLVVVNRWYSRSKRCEVIIYIEDGKRKVGVLPAFNHIGYDLLTMGCARVWGIEQEQKALQLLGGMLRHNQFKNYLLTGMFLEESVRSGVMYVFRRLKPTVALRPTSRESWGGYAHVMCGLCMHPLAYYHGSWAGAMCPTDDVIAHLTMMRGDEHMYWKRASQHPPHRPEAGL